MRIFQLAKEIGLDSKALVELCTKLGIASKGSPLANLSDEEVGRVRRSAGDSGEASGSSSSTPPPTSSGPAAVAEAPVTLAPERVKPRDIKPMRQLGARRGIGLSGGGLSGAGAKSREDVDNTGTADQSDKVDNDESPSIAALSQSSEPDGDSSDANSDSGEYDSTDQVASPPVRSGRGIGMGGQKAESPPPAIEVNAPTSPATPATPAMVRNAPELGGSSRIRDLSSRSRGTSEASKPLGDRKKRPSREPVINLNTRIPKTAAPPPVAKANEPAPMRPEVRLTPEMIAGSRKGMTTPLESFVKAETAKANNKGSSGALSEFKANADKARGRGGKGAGKPEDEGKAGRGNSLSDMRRDRKSRGRRFSADEGDRDDRRGGRSRGKKKVMAAAPRKDKVILELPCTVRSFSEAAGVPAARVLRSLMTMGTMMNINAQLDAETAVMVATDLGVDLEFKEPETQEEALLKLYEDFVDPEEDMEQRPPIVTFLGHVDHGKTSLLDYLIGTKIVSGEAGGITQSIRAYQVQKDGRTISFVDTPGHEAFTEMRARGANVTDIAVLVIAADDGIMPQTQEAIAHAKAAEVPIVVAVNKIDLPGADMNRVMTQMTEYQLTPSVWGGDVEVVGTSAITGEGMDELLETLLTVAELHDYRANPKRPATGICLESEQSADRGVIVKGVVDNGTLRAGDVVVCGTTYGRVKAMYDTLNRNKQVVEAGPTMPVNIIGLESAPDAGERFYVMDDIAQAREIAESRDSMTRRESLSGTTTKVSFDNFQEKLLSGRLGQDVDVVNLNLIIRADMRGSLEAIEKELLKLDHPEVQIRVLQKSVGGITAADVTLASASDAVVLGFNVSPDERARQAAETKGVEVRRYDIIYNMTNDIKALIEGRLKPEERVVELGRALVKQVFAVSRVGTIAGCYVAQGAIERGCRIRISRDNRIIGDYALDTLRRIKDDVKEVTRGLECGIKLAGYNDVKQDDILEAYKIESVARKLD